MFSRIASAWKAQEFGDELISLLHEDGFGVDRSSMQLGNQILLKGFDDSGNISFLYDTKIDYSSGLVSRRLKDVHSSSLGMLVQDYRVDRQKFKALIRDKLASDSISGLRFRRRLMYEPLFNDLLVYRYQTRDFRPTFGREKYKIMVTGVRQHGWAFVCKFANLDLQSLETFDSKLATLIEEHGLVKAYIDGDSRYSFKASEDKRVENIQGFAELVADMDRLLGQKGEWSAALGHLDFMRRLCRLVNDPNLK